MTTAAASGHPWVPDHAWASLPKVSLHDHLDGSLRPETLVEIALDRGEGGRLPSRDPAEVEAWLQNRSDLPRPKDHGELFALLCAVMQQEDTLRRCATEYVATAVADGLVYAEPRWAPQKHLDGGLSLDAAVEAVAAGLDGGMARAAADGHTIVVRQLLCGIRTSPPAMSAEIAALAVRHRHDGVVGFDLAGVEIGFPAREHVEACDIAHAASLPITLHAGEFDGGWNVGESIHVGHAQRIGHGTRLVEDMSIGGVALTAASAVERWDAAGRDADAVTLGPVAAFVRDRQIPLEQCPSSNAGWVVPSFERHPIDLFLRLGFRVTVNPDNRLLSRTSVTGELRKLADTFGWTGADVRRLSLDGLDAAFLDHPTRLRLRGIIEGAPERSGAASGATG